MAELIHKHSVHIRTPEGLRYEAQVLGERQDDGTWVGRIEFLPLDAGAPALETDRETTQTSRDDVMTWALGLEGAYFAGAFTRARVEKGTSVRHPRSTAADSSASRRRSSGRPRRSARRRSP